MSLLTHDDLSSTMSQARTGVCLDAVWEIADLAEWIPTLVSDRGEHASLHRVLRGISQRIQCLSGVVMSGLSDEIETLDSLQRKVGIAWRDEE